MSDTKTKLLDVAERLTQTQGFNGFSYITLSEEVGIKTSSVHYYFRAKADLALALVERIHKQHVAAFNELENRYSNPERRLSSLIEVFQNYVREQKFCMCGMLSAEMQSVSPAVQQALVGYFEDVRKWIEKQLKEMGQKDSKSRALSFISALEGAVLIARLHDEPKMVRAAMKHLKSI